MGTGYIELALNIGYAYYWVDLEVQGGGAAGHAALSAPALAVGIRFFSQIASWLFMDVQGFISLLDLKDDVDSSTWEVTAEILVNPLSTLFIGAGYRVIQYDIEDERKNKISEAVFDGKLSGILVTISYRF